MLRIVIVVLTLLVAGCTQEKTTVETGTQTGKIQILENKGLHGYGVYVLKVDSSEYIINQAGGIVKHK